MVGIGIRGLKTNKTNRSFFRTLILKKHQLEYKQHRQMLKKTGNKLARHWVCNHVKHSRKASQQFL